jgi:hypothetical protein
MAARPGLDATGIDLAGTALATAEHKARGRNLRHRAGGLRAVLPPGGAYFHLGFSNREPGNWSHRRVRKLTQAEIVAAFTDGWRIDSIEPATLEITTDPTFARSAKKDRGRKGSHADR